VYGHRYGTLKSTLDDAVDAGSIIVLDTDVVGALNVKKIRPHAVLAFLAPPSLDVLRSRLENRNTETSERLKKRLDAAPGEMAKMYEYDYIIVNDKLDDAVDAMSAIIEAERHRSFRVEYNGI
jgi:guanylate kinase